jgi:hypothetical protein
VWDTRLDKRGAPFSLARSRRRGEAAAVRVHTRLPILIRIQDTDEWRDDSGAVGGAAFSRSARAPNRLYY